MWNKLTSSSSCRRCPLAEGMNQITATVYVPAKAASDVTVNGKALSEADHVTLLKMDKGKAVLKGGPREYRITLNKNTNK